MKLCTKCDEEKSFEEFNWKSRERGIRHSHCKECTRKEVRNHYEKNIQKYVEKAKRNKVATIMKTENQILDYEETSGRLVSKCKYSVREMIRSGYSFEGILKRCEVEK